MTYYGRKILTRVIIVVLLLAIIAAVALFIVFKLNHNDNKPSSKIYFDYPQSENVVSDEKSGEQYVNNEILISAAKEAKYSDIESLVKEYDGTIIGYIEEFGEYQVRIETTHSREELLGIADKLSESTYVDSASLNYAMNISGSGYLVPDDPWGGNQNWDSNAPEGNNWGVEAINAPQAWDHRDEMSKITIGLIDGGFENHDDLTFAWTRSGTTSDHGCHVAGIMAADFNNSTGISGVMPNQKSNGDSLVDLIGIRENGDEFNEMFTFEFKSAFAELLIRHAKVINVSQGFNWYMGTKNGWDKSYWDNNNITAKAENLANTYAGVLSRFLSRCIHRNYDFVIVCAAGNDDGINARYSSPLTAITDTEVVSHIIVVGAIQNEGREFSLFGNGKHKGYSVASFSNLGERVDIMAPGKDIYSCISENKYDSYNGTSMASPHVAGVAAMVWSLNPNITGTQVKRTVIDSADRPVSKSGRSYSILNAENAVNRTLDAKRESTTQPTTKTAPQYGTIIGKVVDSYSWEMISNAEVKAYSSNGDLVDSASLDSYGQYELLLPEGEYSLTASADGYSSSTMEKIKVEKKQVNYPEWFYLKHNSDDVLSGTFISRSAIEQRFTFSGSDDITMNAFDIVNAKGKYYIDDGMIYIHFNASIDISGYSIPLTDTENGYIWTPSYNREGDSLFISGTEFRKEGSGTLADPGDKSVLMGTYMTNDGLQYFTFSGKNTVKMSLSIISATGTYSIQDDKLIIEYSLFGQSETFEAVFRRNGNSIFIDEVEYIRK